MVTVKHNKYQVILPFVLGVDVFVGMMRDIVSFVNGRILLKDLFFAIVPWSSGTFILCFLGVITLFRDYSFSESSFDVTTCGCIKRTYQWSEYPFIYILGVKGARETWWKIILISRKPLSEPLKKRMLSLEWYALHPFRFFAIMNYTKELEEGLKSLLPDLNIQYCGKSFHGPVK